MPRTSGPGAFRPTTRSTAEAAGLCEGPGAEEKRPPRKTASPVREEDAGTGNRRLQRNNRQGIGPICGQSGVFAWLFGVRATGAIRFELLRARVSPDLQAQRYKFTGSRKMAVYRKQNCIIRKKWPRQNKKPTVELRRWEQGGKRSEKRDQSLANWAIDESKTRRAISSRGYFRCFADRTSVPYTPEYPAA